MADNATLDATPPPPRLTSVIIAANIGNALEWFDFLVYGFFASTLAEVFFPTGDPTISLLVTFGALGLSYVVRPLGAVFIGTYTGSIRWRGVRAGPSSTSIPRVAEDDKQGHRTMAQLVANAALASGQPHRPQSTVKRSANGAVVL